MSTQPTVKETSILFTPENIDKTERGDKTCTRRLSGLDKVNENPGEWAVLCHSTDDPVWRFAHKTKTVSQGGGIVSIRCPFGTVGDWLYVKENWCPRSDGALLLERVQKPFYKIGDGENDMAKPKAWKWRSPLFMPKWAARLWLEITEVRVERVQEITETDAIAEGCIDAYGPDFHVGAFRKLWESINGPGSWNRNDWVWVIGFRKVKA